MEDKDKVSDEVADRKKGYYWVRIGKDDWFIAEFNPIFECWTVTGDDSYDWKDRNFDEIDERQICRS